MEVRRGALALTLEVLATNEAAIYVESAQTDGALFVEIEVEHVLLDLPEVRAVQTIVSHAINGFSCFFYWSRWLKKRTEV